MIESEKMWMCYAEAARPAASDVRSSVDRLARSLEDLAFDAAHEVVYGFGRSGSDEYLRKEEKQYNNGAVICRLFLDGSISKRVFVDLMVGLGLEDCMEEVNSFIEKEEEDDEQKDGAV